MKVVVQLVAALTLLLGASVAGAQEYNDPYAPAQPMQGGSGYGIAPPPTQALDPNTGMPVADPNAPPPGYAEVPPNGAPVDPSAMPEGEMPAEDVLYEEGYDPAAYTQFGSALAPYGTWIDDPSYGRVWVPASNVVGADFAPYYSRGHWVLTEYGWTWVSDYAWGWAPFHYGRWISLASRGWGWVPGTVWGPAWVGWRYGGGYAGWAPLPPRGAPYGGRGYTGSAWRFCPSGEVGTAHPTYAAPTAVPAILRQTSSCNLTRVMNLGEHVVRINAGPVTQLSSASSTVMPLRTAAPSALPRYAIAPRLAAPPAPRPGMGVGAMPYRAPMSIPPGAAAMRPAAPFTGGSEPSPYYGGYRVPVGAAAYGSPVVRPSMPMVQPVVRPPVYGNPNYASPTYAAPMYRPAPSYGSPTYAAPVYRPAPSYGSPTSAAPVSRPAPSYGSPTYAAPVYRPAPVYQAPSYRAPTSFAPVYSAPSFRPAPSFGGGGGGMHFGGFGRRR